LKKLQRVAESRYSGSKGEKIEQSVEALSFDKSVYRFVKRYIEPKISKSISYRIWYAPHMADPKFRDRLKSSEFYKDERVKSILTKYFSYFYL